MTRHPPATTIPFLIVRMPPGAVDGYVATAAQMYADDYRYSPRGSTLVFRRRESVVLFVRMLRDAMGPDFADEAEKPSILQAIQIVKDAAAGQHTPRRENPLLPAAFAGHANAGDFESAPIAASANKAEKMFGVRLTGSLYGCGHMGCAAPLKDGRVLKLTTDALEAKWAKFAYELHLPGTVQVFTEPIVVGRAEWKHGVKKVRGMHGARIFAFIREAAKDVPPALWRQALYRGRMHIVTRSRTAGGRVVLYDEWNEAGPDLLEDVDRARQILAARGYLLDDTKHSNMGLNAAGQIVVRDGQALSQPRVKPRIKTR
jgi:hypothetical protein